MDTHAESHGATHSPRGASLGQGDSVWCLQEQKERRPQPADGERAKMGQGSLKTKELISHIRMKDSGFLPTTSALLTYNYRKKKNTQSSSQTRKILLPERNSTTLLTVHRTDPHKNRITIGSHKAKVVE